MSELSDTDTFRIASELRAIGFSGVRVAILDNKSAQNTSTEFGVLVGTNRGLQVKSFKTAVEAERWLLEA